MHAARHVTQTISTHVDSATHRTSRSTGSPRRGTHTTLSVTRFYFATAARGLQRESRHQAIRPLFKFRDFSREPFNKEQQATFVFNLNRNLRSGRKTRIKRRHSVEPMASV